MSVSNWWWEYFPNSNKQNIKLYAYQTMMCMKKIETRILSIVAVKVVGKNKKVFNPKNSTMT